MWYVMAGFSDVVKDVNENGEAEDVIFVQPHMQPIFIPDEEFRGYLGVVVTDLLSFPS